MNIWAVWPTVSIERSLPMVDIWHRQGYQVAVLVNPPHTHTDLMLADRVIVQNEWRGFPVAANILCREVPGDIVVVAGDDVYPDRNHTAEEIGKRFLSFFPDTCGVMQPTGDEFGSIHNCAVSPWIGRLFIQGAYEGHGPYWEGYYHYFSDQELQEYAIKNKVFCQQKDLVQYHDHWQRKANPQRPPHLQTAKRRWARDRELFQTRQKKGWPVHE